MYTPKKKQYLMDYNTSFLSSSCIFVIYQWNIISIMSVSNRGDEIIYEISYWYPSQCKLTLLQFTVLKLRGIIVVP